MKLKMKLSIMMIAIVIVIAGGLAIIELAQASSIAMGLAKQRAMYLVRQQAQYWDGRMLNYIQTLQTLSNVMNYYESRVLIPPKNRRQGRALYPAPAAFSA
jgi:methyl-accepting chemotaxis protein